MDTSDRERRPHLRTDSAGFAHAAAVTRLEHEAKLTAEIDAEAVGACAELLGGTRVRSVADLGCGPGLATVEVARAFPDATVVAVDSSEAMLRSVAQRADREGLAARIATRQLDLNEDLTGLGPEDVVWSSMAVHHTEDPERLIAGIATMLRPGGVLCVLEHADPPVVHLASDLGRPGLWERLEAVRASLPHGGHQGIDALPRVIEEATLSMQDDRVLHATHNDPTRPELREYAYAQLGAVVTRLHDRVDPRDLGALQSFVEGTTPRDAGGWEGLGVCVSRRVLIARARY